MQLSCFHSIRAAIFLRQEPSFRQNVARNLDDLRAFVHGLTRKGVRVEFVK